MTGEGDMPRPSPAQRLLARERHIAALEAGEDRLVEEAAPREQYALIAAFVKAEPGRLALLFVPDPAHPAAALARDEGVVAAMVVAPDMSEAARRDLGIALRSNAVQLLAVTPERLSQPRFIQFVRSQDPAMIAVASAQCLHVESAAYHAPYESLRALRALFPGVPVLAQADGPQPPPVHRAIADALGLRDSSALSGTPGGASSVPQVPAAPDSNPTGEPAPPQGAPNASEPAPSPAEEREATPTPAAAPARPAPRRPAPVPEEFRAAFPRFDQEQGITEVASHLERDERWVYEALAAYIREHGRTHPFPWIDKPTYLNVAMAAGQSESINPRLVRSVLGDAVDPGAVAVVMAALENRQTRDGLQG